MNLHQADVTRRMTDLLSRRTAPRAIAGNAEAQKSEISALVRAVMRHAPREGLETWWQGFEDALLSRMKTHGWPIQSEIDAAAGSLSKRRDSSPEFWASRAEDWYRQHGTPLPGANNAEITESLIRRGVLKDEREARFRGFVQSQSSVRVALSQKMGRGEFEHHVSVLARLMGADYEDVAYEERHATT